MLLLDKVYDINKHLISGDKIWDKLQVKRAIGLVISLFVNNVLPLFLCKSKETLNKGERVPVIVSITSFPARIGRVWLTIESMMFQTHKPQAIILWLSHDQFPNEFEDLPKRLVLQQRRGLTIRFVDGDIKSYKKFYYAFHEFKNSLVLTLDDDLLMPSYFLKSICDCKKHHPKDVIASFGFHFLWDNNIGYIRPTGTKINPGDSGKNLFFGSGGGTLFDTAVVSKMESIDKIMEICPTADDIYLNALFRICGFGVTFHMNNPLLSIKSRNNVTLVSHNGDIGNPTSVNAKQLKQLVAYLEGKGYDNPFEV